MEVVFRKAIFDDLEAIISLCNQCFDENTSLDYAKKKYLESIDDENQIYLIGIVEKKIVAHTKITIIPTIFEEMNTYAILNHVCVNPEYRRHNIGTKMLIECEKILKQKNCVSIELWSMNFRQPAHELYKSFGFIVKDAKFFSKKLYKI